jgi:hypothetical protein
MDNCSAHLTDDVIRLLTGARVRVITFAPHTTQIFDVLDLMHFGVFKRRPRYELPLERDNATVTFIMKGYCDFAETINLPNVWGAFDALGLVFHTGRAMLSGALVR